jgi:excisionase family DNA binding protein
MSSNIKVQRICQHCGKEFTARTTVTQYCGDKCAKAAYKAKLRAEKVEASNKETQRIKTQPIEAIQVKEFLTVREVATLLNCSPRTVYYFIENGSIEAVNLGQRITRVKREALNKLFKQPQPLTPQPKQQKQFDISECYTISEAQNKYGISEKALYEILKRNIIPKIKQGRFTYIPKTEIDKLFR